MPFLSVFPVRLFTGQCKTSVCDQTSAQFIFCIHKFGNISKILRAYNVESWFVPTALKFCNTFGVKLYLPLKHQETDSLHQGELLWTDINTSPAFPPLTALLEEYLVSYHLEDNTFSFPFTSSENNSFIRCNKVHCFKYFCMKRGTEKQTKIYKCKNFNKSYDHAIDM